jgi:chromosome segregation ATPase
LVSRERKAQAWLEEARSAHLSLEVQRDQGNNKLAHAEEEIARLQESLGELEKKAHFSEKQAAEKVRHVLAESDSAQSVRGELDDRVRIITRQLEAANKQNRTLQQDTERLKSAMAEADEQASKRVSGLEKQMADLERKLREAIVERDTIEAEVKMVKSALGDAKDKYVEQETLLRQAEIDRRDANERARKAHDAHKLRLELVNEQVSKYQTQLSLTKKRLAIMEDQKKVLAAEAARLREDLSSQRMSATPPAAPKALANAEGKSQEAVE